MSVQHAAIVDPNIHEPKGVSTAPNGGVYVANGAGSGVWYTKAQLAALLLPELGIPAAVPYGGLYWTADSVTTITTSGVFVKAAGTTTATNLLQFDTNSTSNRLRYTGTASRHFSLVAGASLKFVTGTNQVAELGIYHYDASEESGAMIPHSDSRALVPGSDFNHLVTNADIFLDENDYIELWLANETNTNNLSVIYGYLSAMGHN